MRVQSCGGGGYGPAVERDPQLVLHDVHEGKVSLEPSAGGLPRGDRSGGLDCGRGGN